MQADRTDSGRLSEPMLDLNDTGSFGPSTKKLRQTMLKAHAEVTAAKQMRESGNQRLKLDRGLTVSAVCAILLMIVQSILVWYAGTGPTVLASGVIVPADNTELWLIVVVTSSHALIALFTILSLALLAMYYKVLLNDKRMEWSQGLMKTKHRRAPSAGSSDMPPSTYRFLSSTLFPKLVLEIVIHLLFPYPWIKEGRTVYHTLQIAMFLRLYVVFRLLHTSSAAFRRRTEMLRFYDEFRRMNWQVKPYVTLKILFYEYPGIMVLACTFVTLFLSAFSLFMLERKRPSNHDFADLGNCLWFSFVTFTTIGYGDMTPDTTPGRFVTVIIALIGQLIISIFSGVITNKLAPSKQQQLISSFLQTETGEAGYRHAAALLIQSVWRSSRGCKLDSIYAEPRSKSLASPLMRGMRNHKKNKVYAAVKKFRSKRCELVEAQLQAGDPVVDRKLDKLTDDVSEISSRLAELFLLAQGGNTFDAVPLTPSLSRGPADFHLKSTASSAAMRSLGTMRKKQQKQNFVGNLSIGRGLKREPSGMLLGLRGSDCSLVTPHTPLMPHGPRSPQDTDFFCKKEPSHLTSSTSRGAATEDYVHVVPIPLSPAELPFAATVPPFVIDPAAGHKAFSKQSSLRKERKPPPLNFPGWCDSTLKPNDTPTKPTSGGGGGNPLVAGRPLGSPQRSPSQASAPGQLFQLQLDGRLLGAKQSPSLPASKRGTPGDWSESDRTEPCFTNCADSIAAESPTLRTPTRTGPISFRAMQKPSPDEQFDCNVLKGRPRPCPLKEPASVKEAAREPSSFCNTLDAVTPDSVAESSTNSEAVELLKAAHSLLKPVADRPRTGFEDRRRSSSEAERSFSVNRPDSSGSPASSAINTPPQHSGNVRSTSFNNACPAELLQHNNKAPTSMLHGNLNGHAHNHNHNGANHANTTAGPGNPKARHKFPAGSPASGSRHQSPTSAGTSTPDATKALLAHNGSHGALPLLNLHSAPKLSLDITGYDGNPRCVPASSSASQLFNLQRHSLLFSPTSPLQHSGSTFISSPKRSVSGKQGPALVPFPKPNNG
ncbi:Small conductance calcium-activated potassium channel protein [Diplonema papillatum]|nr:Small conductance calcium-activated potassium channel protein [Diplonema papillatum]